MDKKKIKENLEEEKKVLLEQLSDIGKLNPETNEWEAVPEERESREADQNDMADRFEDFEARSATIKSLETRLRNVLSAMEELHKESFGKCEVCGKYIEASRIKANPAARTCKKHLEELEN